MMPGKYVGLDGCAAGWVAVALSSASEFGIDVFPGFAEAVDAHHDSLILVDIPIGLRDSGAAERLCDRAARAVLGPRASSVFPAAVRAALAAADYERASLINSEKTRSERGLGRRLSKQSFAILPKIREVDEFLARRSSPRPAVREMHPELCFWALNGGRPLQFNKKRPEGHAGRVGVLRAHLPALAAFVEERVRARVHRGVAADDIVDAAAGAATGFLSGGSPRSLPPDPERDSSGLPMEMVYCTL